MKFYNIKYTEKYSKLYLMANQLFFSTFSPLDIVH